MQTYPSLRAKEGARGHFDPNSKKLCSRLKSACCPKLYFWVAPKIFGRACTLPKLFLASMALHLHAYMHFWVAPKNSEPLLKFLSRSPKIFVSRSWCSECFYTCNSESFPNWLSTLASAVLVLSPNIFLRSRRSICLHTCISESLLKFLSRSRLQRKKSSFRDCGAKNASIHAILTHAKTNRMQRPRSSKENKVTFVHAYVHFWRMPDSP